MGDTTRKRAAGGVAAPQGAGAPARLGRTVDPYWVLAGVLALLLVAQTFNRRWSTDFWLHKATIDAFRQNLAHPVQPLTGTHDHFEYYSPYTFVLAAFARVSGWSSLAVLQLAAIFNLGLFLVAFRAFVGKLTTRPAVTGALVATLFFWGWHPWRWSGFLNFDSIGFGLPFPSMFATGLALLVGWALLHYDATRDARWLPVVAAGYATVLLSHPFTGVWSSVLLAALVVHRRLYRGAPAIRLAVVLVVVGIALALWPYYSFFQLLRYQHHAEPSTLYSGVPVRVCASLVGLVAVVRRVRRDRTDPLALMLVGGALLYAFGAVRSNYNFGRVLPLVLLPVHIGIGELLVASWRRTERQSPAVLGWLGLSAVVGFAGVVTAFGSMAPRALLPDTLKKRSDLQPITHQYRALDHALPAGSVIVVQTSEMEELVAAYGFHPLAVDWAGAFVHDAPQRLASSREILNAKTTDARRKELLARYHVVAALCSRDSCRKLFTGDRIEFGGTTTLIRFRP